MLYNVNLCFNSEPTDLLLCEKTWFYGSTCKSLRHHDISSIVISSADILSTVIWFTDYNPATILTYRNRTHQNGIMMLSIRILSIATLSIAILRIKKISIMIFSTRIRSIMTPSMRFEKFDNQLHNQPQKQHSKTGDSFNCNSQFVITFHS